MKIVKINYYKEKLNKCKSCKELKETGLKYFLNKF